MQCGFAIEQIRFHMKIDALQRHVLIERSLVIHCVAVGESEGNLVVSHFIASGSTAHEIDLHRVIAIGRQRAEEMIAHDRAVEQRVISTFGGEVEGGGKVGRFEAHRQDLPGFAAERVLRSFIALDRLLELHAAVATLVDDLLDSWRDVGGRGVRRQ